MGDINPGLTSAYADIAYPAGVAIQQVTNAAAWTVFQSGADNLDGLIDELGGSALPGGLGIEPTWIRLGYVRVQATATAPAATFQALASATGVATKARGLIAWQNILLTGATITQGLAGDIDGDGDRDGDDLSTYVAVLLGTDTNPAHRVASDFDGNGDANGNDTPGFIGATLEP